MDGMSVSQLPSGVDVHPWAAERRPIHIRRPGYTRLGLQGSERGSSPRPLIEAGILKAVIPRRCPAELRRAPKSCLHERQAGVLSTSPEKSQWVLLVWQIGCIHAFLFFSWTHSQVVSRSMADRGSERRRRHAGFRAGDEFYQTTQSPVHLALKCSEFSMHRVRKKEDACRHQKA